MALKFYIIDTETNGLKTSWHEINQISIIRCEDGFQKTLNIAIDFPGRSNPEALRIQKKTIYDLRKGIHRSEAIQEIEEFILEDEATTNGRVFCAHNASFDARFLTAMWEMDKKIFPADLWMCTKEFSRMYAKKQGIIKPKLNLQACLDMVGITARPGAHSAAGDTANTHALFNKLMSENLNYLPLIKQGKKPVSAKKSNEEQYEEFE